MIDKLKKAIKNPYLIILFLKIKAFNFLKSKKIISKNSELKNIHLGERCFIIGNGPSINKQDIKLLKNEFTFVVNEFHFHKDFKIIRPTYYCIIDEYYFKEENIRTLRAIENAVINSPDTTFFFPAFFKGFIEKNKLFKNNRKYYLAFKGSILKTYPSVFLDISKPISGGNFVAFTCLFIAKYMGFKKIYLIGFDHDWQIVDGKDLGYHFYDQEGTTQSVPPEKLYYLKNPSLRERYLIIKDLFSKDGVEIFNATEGGYLDVFERVRYEDIFLKKFSK